MIIIHVNLLLIFIAPQYPTHLPYYIISNFCFPL